MTPQEREQLRALQAKEQAERALLLEQIRQREAAKAKAEHEAWLARSPHRDRALAAKNKSTEALTHMFYEAWKEGYSEGSEAATRRAEEARGWENLSPNFK